MPVGNEERINTNKDKGRCMMAAPTMRRPDNIAFTRNAENAFRAILIARNNFNGSKPRRTIKTLVCSGLGTGIGSMEPVKCAVKMRVASKLINETARISSVREIHK